MSLYICFQVLSTFMVHRLTCNVIINLFLKNIVIFKSKNVEHIFQFGAYILSVCFPGSFIVLCFTKYEVNRQTQRNNRTLIFLYKKKISLYIIKASSKTTREPKRKVKQGKIFIGMKSVYTGKDVQQYRHQLQNYKVRGV